MRVIVAVRRPSQFDLGVSTRRRALQRRRVRPDERIDDFGQRTQMKVEQAADGMMVVKPIAFGR
jgi:hypothetical protein